MHTDSSGKRRYLTAGKSNNAHAARLAQSTLTHLKHTRRMPVPSRAPTERQHSPLCAALRTVSTGTPCYCPVELPVRYEGAIDAVLPASAIQGDRVVGAERVGMTMLWDADLAHAWSGA